MQSLRTLFFGTAPFARVSLDHLARASVIQLAGVVTQPDRPRGRHLSPQFSPVKEAALALNLPVFQPEKARHPSFLQTVAGLELDLIVVAAYGQILPQALLDLPKFGALNVHGSLLPKYRGAAPIQWSILNDEAETGVTIMKMDAGLDTGPMVSKFTTEIGAQDNAQTLHDRLAELGGKLLVDTIPGFVSGEIKPVPQGPEFSYAPKILKEHGLVDWKLSGREVWNRMRAFTPWPGAFSYLQLTGKRLMLKLWEGEPCDGEGTPGTILTPDASGIVIACGDGAIRVAALQKEGGKKLVAREFLLGTKLESGMSLVSQAA